MKVELLRDGAKAAAAHPEHLNMSEFIIPSKLPFRENVLLPNKELACGTTLCLAGWIVFLNNPDGLFGSVPSEAYKILEDNDQVCESLFFCEYDDDITADNIVQVVEQFIIDHEL